MANPGVFMIKPRRFGDDRGWFSETYHEGKFAQLGLDVRFVQDNHSLSRPAGTLRGLHFQHAPAGQAKLVRCLRGKIFDVAVDIRKGSPSFGKWASAELSAEGGEQLFVPEGFLHGFMTLEPDTEVAYKVTSFYAPQCDAGVRWDDPDIAIRWPLAPGESPVLSNKDAALPRLAEIVSSFTFTQEDVPLGPLEEKTP